MKRFIKNNIKVFVAVVISAIIFGGIGVYAASQYFAKDITFTPTNEKFKKENGEPIDNVEDAINALYDKHSNLGECVSGKFKCTSCNTSEGQKIVDFEPTTFMIYRNGLINYYNNKLDESNFYAYTTEPYYSKNLLSSRFKINNGLFLNNVSLNTWGNIDIYYFACK